jgi:hypothetical protein
MVQFIYYLDQSVINDTDLLVRSSTWKTHFVWPQKQSSEQLENIVNY